MVTEADFYIEDLKTKFSKINKAEYYLAYSGGRDSHFIYWFIKNILRDEEIRIISVNTLLEHPEIKKRIHENADEVLLPSKKHSDIKKEHGIPCFTKIQDNYISLYQKGNRSENTLKSVNGGTKFELNKTAKTLLLNNSLHKISNKCCEYLKKKPLRLYEKKHKLKPIICIRSAESLNRNKINSCFGKTKNFYPIWDLTDELLKRIEKEKGINVPSIYNYVTRTGCMGCPYGRNIEKELSLLSPAQRRFVEDYFKESYEVKGIDKKQKRINEY